MSINALFPIHFAATWFLVGLIWLVQVVVYPQFLRVTPECFPAYHKAHATGITYVVGPVMIVQLVTSIWMLALTLQSPQARVFWVGAACTVVCWLSTAIIQVPLHNQLAAGVGGDVAARLTATNWIRTISWSIQGVLLVFWMIWPTE